MKALQTLIGILYAEFLESSEFLLQLISGHVPTSNLPKVSTLELENIYKLLNQFIIIIEKLHIRIEDEYSSHIPCSIGQ